MKRIVDLNHEQNIKSAKDGESARGRSSGDASRSHHRAPGPAEQGATLTPSSASRPSSRSMVEGKAIQLHPFSGSPLGMVCTEFNADSTGDQWRLHCPVAEAQAAARTSCCPATTSVADGR